MAEHAERIVFCLTGALPTLDPVDQAAVNAIPRNSKLEIKVLDDPTTTADLKGKVLPFIGAVNIAATRDVVVIDEVTYAMVCPVRPGAILLRPVAATSDQGLPRPTLRRCRIRHSTASSSGCPPQGVNAVLGPPQRMRAEDAGA